MRPLRATILVILGSALLSGLALGAEFASKDQELLNQGKILIFDKNWQGARSIFQRVIQEFPQSSLVPQAYYYIARCYQFQGREIEAIRAYELFIKKYSDDPFLLDARNAVVELAASLIDKGDATYKDRLVDSLTDAQKEVRYFAAIRCSRLGDQHIASLAVPVLKEIVKKETERELVDRARIALLRLDPKALSRAVEAPEKRQSEKRSETRMFHLTVYKEGDARPVVELSIPVSLAQLAILALDESAKRELRKKGFDVDNVWESLKRLGPTNILTLRDGENLVKLWIE